MSERIPIRNIYYMLAYAYRTLHLVEYQQLAAESFSNVTDLYAEILAIGLPVLIRGGLTKDYIRVEEPSMVVRGKIDLPSSIKKNVLVDKRLIVVYDTFSEDILTNQLLKATLVCLARSPKIPPIKRKHFYGLLPYFSGVSDIELGSGIWKRVHYHRGNIRYLFLVEICRYLYEALLLSSGDGSTQQCFEDDQRLSALFEKFVFAFYQKETSYKVTHPQIPWHVDNQFNDALPTMQTDMVIQHENRIVIVDTKFYAENMATKFQGSAAKQHSGNLYQMFTYVNNFRAKSVETVSGLLLYARTLSVQQPNHHYEIHGHRMSVLTIDLNQPFEGIKRDLLQYLTDCI